MDAPSQLLCTFFAEQKRLADNYIAEGCVIRKGIVGNRTCDISVNPAQLDISMVPCNFIPIQPKLYTGMQFIRNTFNIQSRLLSSGHHLMISCVMLGRYP